MTLKTLKTLMTLMTLMITRGSDRTQTRAYRRDDVLVARRHRAALDCDAERVRRRARAGSRGCFREPRERRGDGSDDASALISLITTHTIRRVSLDERGGERRRAFRVGDADNRRTRTSPFDFAVRETTQRLKRRGCRFFAERRRRDAA
jgi:hypothetical protein